MEELTQAIIVENAKTIFLPAVLLLITGMLINLLLIFAKGNTLIIKIFGIILLTTGGAVGAVGLYLTSSKGTDLKEITLSQEPFTIEKVQNSWGPDKWVFQNRWNQVQFPVKTVQKAVQNNPTAKKAFESKINFSEEGK